MNLLSKRIYLFYFSIVAIVISIILLVIPGLPLGIDFTSGSTYCCDKSVSIALNLKPSYVS